VKRMPKGATISKRPSSVKQETNRQSNAIAEKIRPYWI
jgi:hypothetical protein